MLKCLNFSIPNHYAIKPPDLRPRKVEYIKGMENSLTIAHVYISLK